MVKITSDKPDNEKNIVKLCGYFEKNGGYIAPDIEIRDVKGQISVHADPDFSSEYIFKAPHELLVPYDNFDFDIKGHDIVIAHDDGNASETHLEVLENMLRLYNDAGKFKAHLAEHPLLHYAEASDLVLHLLKGRDGSSVDFIEKIIAKPDFFDELALLTFFRGRLFSAPLSHREAKDSAVFLPVLEFLNHHAEGSRYADDGGSGQMTLTASMPAEGSRECFARYGRLDSLDVYMHYGFVDQSPGYVRSVPVDIDLGDIGKISVGAQNISVPSKAVPERLRDLVFYFPEMRVDQESKCAELSHLLVPQEKAPLSMRRILEFVIQTLEPEISESECLSCMGAAENQILTLNMDFYEKAGFLTNKIDKNSIVKRDVLSLSELQMNRITNYKNIVNGL